MMSTLISVRLLALSHNILVGKLRKYGVDEWTVRYTGWMEELIGL